MAQPQGKGHEHPEEKNAQGHAHRGDEDGILATGGQAHKVNQEHSPHGGVQKRGCDAHIHGKGGKGEQKADGNGGYQPGANVPQECVGKPQPHSSRKGEDRPQGNDVHAPNGNDHEDEQGSRQGSPPRVRVGKIAFDGEEQRALRHSQKGGSCAPAGTHDP